LQYITVEKEQAMNAIKHLDSPEVKRWWYKQGECWNYAVYVDGKRIQISGIPKE
jgi:hypothetical protein